ncbi:hypothetical protein UMM65_04280 [Aureibaculum sp. 2210JD6-5]|uniref:hypothetical protein n=1 Tax=Aureibaculum sp. 2210JD6-5 TaxID=3103957 RepID=UPI002AAEE48E|nr:hypothetical protein [Aureibaculum sp. 2210JD6-5]MDY7394447.1 hypothetical protein [Aureibaculum sp. 2210JD6-5]
MRKLVLALSAVLVLASFTNSTNKTTILKDIDGTLLQSYPVIETIDGNHKITFAVNANTIVTSNVVDNQTHINLVENGFSNKIVTHTITFSTSSVDFNNFFESNFDVASNEDDAPARRIRKGKPKKLME